MADKLKMAGVIGEKLIAHRGSKALPRAAEKRGLVLKYIKRWKFTDRTILGHVLKTKATQTYDTVLQMINAGLIQETRINGCPTPLLILTKSGNELAEMLLAGTPDAGLPAPIFKSDTKHLHASHDLLAQSIVCDWLNKFPDMDVLSDHQCRHREIAICNGNKIADALMTLNPMSLAMKWALEVQQSREDDEITERKLSEYAHAIKRGEIYGVIYASTYPSRLQQLTQIASGPVRSFWYNSNHKRWYMHHIEDSNPFTYESLKARIIFLPIQHLATRYYTYQVR